MSDDNNTLSENAKGWMILGVIFAVMCWALWYMMGTEIKHVFRIFRWSELWVISQISHFLPFLIDPEYLVNYQGLKLKLSDAVDRLLDVPKEQLSGQLVNAASLLAMAPFKWIGMILLTCMAAIAYEHGPGTQFRRKMGLNELIAAQSRVFPVITPFINFNPSTMPARPPGAPVPADLPIFAEALGPEEWIAYNNIPIPDGKLDEKATYFAFARQLGPRWKGASRLSPDRQVFLAACCLRAARKRAESDELLGRLACCWSHDKGLRLKRDGTLVRDARAVLRNKDIAGKVLPKVNQHAFQTTAMMRALAVAREEGGVMAPAQFVWMRGHDRVLWYPLNNLGRQTVHMEALGAMAHYMLEKRTSRPVPRPKVDDSVRSLVEYMDSGRASPIPPMDYSGSKKRGVQKPKKAKKK